MIINTFVYNYAFNGDIQKRRLFLSPVCNALTFFVEYQIHDAKLRLIIFINF